MGFTFDHICFVVAGEESHLGENFAKKEVALATYSANGKSNFFWQRVAPWIRRCYILRGFSKRGFSLCFSFFQWEKSPVWGTSVHRLPVGSYTLYSWY